MENALRVPEDARMGSLEPQVKRVYGDLFRAHQPGVETGMRVIVWVKRMN